MTTHHYRVWAPRPGAVALVVDDQEIPMAAAGGGWWEAEAQPGDYGFRLDGGPIRPDPRSPWQPTGVRGRSRAFDHAAFEWTDERWGGIDLAEAVLYELHVGTFTPEGTFEAAIGRLDHLRELGVSAVELMPVNEFPGRRGWGYDGVLLYAPHHAYGGPDGLKAFVDAAHGAGIGVVLDVVYNHLGPSGNHLSEFGPYFTDRYRTPWGEAVNLDGPGSDEVRAFIVDNVRQWVCDYHVDGLRLDAVHALHDEGAVHILEEIAAVAHRTGSDAGRTVAVVAETDRNDPRTVVPVAEHGLGIDAQWSDDFHHTLHTVLTGERSGYYEDFGRLADVAHALRHVFVYDGRFSPHRQRRHGRPVGDTPGWRFLGYLQNHDQVGNRAAGERITMLTSPARARIGAALMVCAPFVPMLFQGEEWAASSPFLYFTDHDDPELGRAVSDGRRAEFAYFGWRPEDVPDPQDEATFRRSVLRWDEMGQGDHAEMLDWYRRLLEIRRAVPALRRCDRTHVHVEFEEGRWLLLDRGEVVVAANVGPEPEAIAWAPGWPARVALASAEGCEVRDDHLHLPPDSVAVVCR